MQEVVVLLSTYNGEKYVQEQIESIMNQSYSKIVLYIRDDGSSDNTVNILKSYEGNKRIVLEYGENIGFFASFMKLLNGCQEAAYYAFSDQDDYWYPDKIEAALNMLKQKNDIPAVYCCNWYLCDANMVIQREGQKRKMPFSIRETIVSGVCGYGFTQVFNNQMRELVLKKKNPPILKCFGHDSWIHLLGLCCGEVIYDRTIHAKMRRHGGNASNQEYQGGTWWRHQWWRIKEFLLQENGKIIYKEVLFFYNQFYEVIPEDDKKIIKFYVCSGHRINKAFCKKRYREKLIDELFVRILFLLGKV